MLPESMTQRQSIKMSVSSNLMPNKDFYYFSTVAIYKKIGYTVLLKKCVFNNITYKQPPPCSHCSVTTTRRNESHSVTER
jgi:hypothetical protein